MRLSCCGLPAIATVSVLFRIHYTDNMFYEYRNMSAQEFRHKLNELINKEIFFGSLADCAQTAKNSDSIMEFLAAMGWNQGYAA